MWGICQMCLRGRRFSHLLPGDKYPNHSSKSDQRVENSRNFVGYDSLAPCPGTAFIFLFYANSMIWALFCSLEQKTKTTTKKQTKQNKQNRSCAKVTYWNVTQQELKAESKTKKNKTKTVAGSNQYTLNENLVSLVNKTPFFKICSQRNLWYWEKKKVLILFVFAFAR